MPDLERHHKSFPYLKYPLLRDGKLKTSEVWLKGKQLQDGAEGLWRIHDSLYDFTSFIKLHPGGEQWLQSTKGTDITEAFETHHIKGIAEEITQNYFIKKAESPRNSPFTFKDDGFYKTLKPKIAAKLKELPPHLRKRSDMILDGLLLLVFILNPLGCWMWSKNWIVSSLFVVINGLLLSSVTICAHNYFHRRDNWRMYVFNISGLSYESWRITHALSHHLHTNTFQDIEITMFEPFLQFMPYRDKMFWAQLGAFYWPFIFPFANLASLLIDVIASSIKLEGKNFNWTMSIPFILPIWMYLFGGLSFLSTFCLWIVIMMVASFYFIVFGLTAGHHAHVNFFDGDIPREQHPDWGEYQLDVIVERLDYAGNHFKSITRFGDHALHHLFPTVDHGELKYLYPTLLEHCEKFDVKLRMTDVCGAIISHSKQLIRKTPNDFSKRN